MENWCQKVGHQLVYIQWKNITMDQWHTINDSQNRGKWWNTSKKMIVKMDLQNSHMIVIDFPM